MKGLLCCRHNDACEGLLSAKASEISVPSCPSRFCSCDFLPFWVQPLLVCLVGCRAKSNVVHAGVIAFSEVLGDVGNHGKYSLSLYDMGRFMRLDAAAQRALNVMKTKFDANDNFSLYGLMSRARTTMGKRLLKVSQPTILPSGHASLQCRSVSASVVQKLSRNALASVTTVMTGEDSTPSKCIAAVFSHNCMAMQCSKCRWLSW